MIVKMKTSKVSNYVGESLEPPKKKHSKVEALTFTFGILNIIAAIDLIIIGIIVLICGLPLLSTWLAPWAHLVTNFYDQIKDLEYPDVDQRLFVILSDAVTIWFFNNFVPWVLIIIGAELLLFSILLLVGIYKKMVKLVMAFLIFGFISMPISLLVHCFYIVAYSAKTGAGFTEYFGIYTLQFVIFIELMSAYITVQKLNRSQQSRHKELVERY